MDYYLQTKDGQQAGPYSLNQMKAFWASGQITLTTPYWTSGMSGWYPVRAIEKLLAAQTPSVTPPVAVQTPEKPKRKSIGCGQAFVLLVLLFGAFIAFVMVMSPDEEDTSKPKVDPSWNKGYASAYQLGYVCALSDYKKGALKESPELLAANARELCGGSTDAQYRDGVMRGLKSGYEQGWKDGGH
jgi:hypothetical protein